jgi:hypothetical protein
LSVVNIDAAAHVLQAAVVKAEAQTVFISHYSVNFISHFGACSVVNIQITGVGKTCYRCGNYTVK